MIVGTPIVGDAQNSLVGPTVISTALWGSRGYEVIPARSLGRRKRSGGGYVIIDAASMIYGTSVDESLFWTLVPGRRADDACTC